MTSTDVGFRAAVEGDVDEAVVARLIQFSGARLDAVHGKRGRQYLQSRIAAYERAARLAPWIVLVDLDRDDCAPSLIRSWAIAPTSRLCLRVAVRSVESWILADRAAMAEYLRVPAGMVPRNPDSLPDPKAALCTLAERSRSREIREDIAPRRGSGRSVGPGYSSRMIEFARSKWRPDRAARESPSLDRCVRRLSDLVSGGA